MKTVPISVKVGAKVVESSKRVWDDADVRDVKVIELTTDDVLKRLNYAEDLFARSTATRLNSDVASKTMRREEADMAVLNGEVGPEAQVEYLRLKQVVTKSLTPLARKAARAEVNVFLDAISKAYLEA